MIHTSEYFQTLETGLQEAEEKNIYYLILETKQFCTSQCVPNHHYEAISILHSKNQETFTVPISKSN